MKIIKILLKTIVVALAITLLILGVMQIAGMGSNESIFTMKNFKISIIVIICAFAYAYFDEKHHGN